MIPDPRRGPQQSSRAPYAGAAESRLCQSWATLEFVLFDWDREDA